MNFNNLLEIANVNKQNKPSTKGFSTAVAPAKKPPRSNVPSDAVKKFLEKRDQMERQKEVEAKRQREKLLALRAQNAKSNKAAKLMSSRTKDNDFSRIRLTEDEVETKKKMEVQLQRQMLTDKVERMKARIKIQEEQEALPHKRKRKSKLTGQPLEADEPPPEPIKDIIPEKRMKLDGNWTHVKPKGEPQKFRASKAPKAPLSFNELIRIAAEKQKNPNYQSEEEVEEYSDDQERDERLMTKKERMKHVEEQEHFNRSPNKKQTARQDRPNSSKHQSSSRPTERQNQSRDQNRPVSNDNRNDSRLSRPLMHTSRQSMSNHRPNPASKPLLNGSSKSMINSRAPPSNSRPVSQDSKQNSRDSRLQHPSANNQARTNQPSSKSTREEISRSQQSRSSSESRGINGASKNGQNMDRNPNRPDSKPIPSYNTAQSKPRPSLGQNSRPQSGNRPNSVQNSSLNSRNNGNQGQNRPNSSKPSNSNASVRPQNDGQNQRVPTYNTSTKKVIKQAPSRLRNVDVDIFVEDNSSSNGPINHPSSKPVPRSTNPFGGVNSSTKNIIRPAGQISSLLNRPNERTNSNSTNRMNERPNSNSTNRMNERPNSNSTNRMNERPNSNSNNRMNERPGSNSSNRMNERPGSNSSNRMNERPGSNSSNRMNERTSSEHQAVRGRGENPHLPPPKRRPSPSAFSRRAYPPSRHDPYPPSRALARNPYQKLPPITSSRPVRRIESDDEEDEDDEEMREFIDDDPIEDMEDYSRHIKEIFGYDKHRYLFEDDFDDEAMESSYAQQMKEELTSARLGFLEDMEDMKKEQEELKRKQLKKKGKLK